MKLKKSMTILLAILCIFIFSSLAYATNYYLDTSGNIDAYGYGADWYGQHKAIESSNGYFSDITGVKARCKVYRNGILITDTSNSDTTSPYSARVSGSESSSSSSNSWKATVMTYYKTGSATSYTYGGTISYTDSN